ncbi:MAG TPA: twin-arginine translocase subunit TatC [Vicinamibacterales bacterium]|nr:twin-arginine translocase subunit TatC [Vicinamibacterales bacterium]
MAVSALPPPVLDPEEEAEPEEDATGKMSFLEHLDELRKRLITSVASIAVGFLVCLFFINQIFAFIMRPLQLVLPHGGKFIYTEPTEMFMLQMKGAALAGLVLAAPMVLYQLWLFIAPGLYSHEKKFAIPFVLLTSFFFMAGVAFSHFIAFPWAWVFFASFTTDYVDFMPKVAPVFSLYAKMLLAFGLIFQLPTIVLFLSRFGMITPRFLLRNFKYAFLAIFVIAAVLSPGTDIVSQLMMAVPMLLLYIISIAVAWLFRPRARREAESSAPGN